MIKSVRYDKIVFIYIRESYNHFLFFLALLAFAISEGLTAGFLSTCLLSFLGGAVVGLGLVASGLPLEVVGLAAIFFA